ncbi:MAG: glycosyltransferase family 4 protein [Gammaproteobacteria bacterium]|nr:glycosyltransferase family 4 protein [Gammaproteobacteria bacterium]
MQLALIADAYPPMKTSGAVQIRDLVAELEKQGHLITVLLPDSSLKSHWELNEGGGVKVLRLKAPETKDVNYFRRFIGEYLLSFFMCRNLQKSPLKNKKWDGIIWYSPSIFFGRLVKKLKAESRCPAYLILRDIFPEWAVDMGLLGNGLMYRYFKKVERFQYQQADVIGVQTPSNLQYFSEHQPGLGAEMEVLNNWLADSKPGECSINLKDTALAGRKIFAYTGNIGIAQAMDILIDLANELKEDSSVGFVFVGRGTAVEQIKKRAVEYNLNNILFYDEISPEEIPGLLAQCHIGLIALDPRHRNDNIPGKFLAYMQAGLPVLANINAGNDLKAIVDEYQVGGVEENNSLSSLTEMARDFLTNLESDKAIQQRCQDLSSAKFSPASAASQIISSLESASASSSESVR